jgi:hypothetical protein
LLPQLNVDGKTMAEPVAATSATRRTADDEWHG